MLVEQWKMGSSEDSACRLLLLSLLVLVVAVAVRCGIVTAVFTINAVIIPPSRTSIFDAVDASSRPVTSESLATEK